jgi:hypothetical protein
VDITQQTSFGLSPYQRPRGLALCFVPAAVRIVGRRLHWDLGPQPWKRLSPAKIDKALSKFLRIARYGWELPDNERIIEFASEFGCLGITDVHSKKMGTLFPINPDYKWACHGFLGALAPAQKGSEPLDNWVLWSSEFSRAWREVLSADPNHQVPDYLRLQLREDHGGYRGDLDDELARKWLLDRVSAQVTNWLQLGGCGSVVLEEGQICAGPLSLFGELARRLALLIDGHEIKSICSGCRRTFKERKKPTRGQRIYCPRCRARGIPVRDAVRAYRERKRSIGTT